MRLKNNSANVSIFFFSYSLGTLRFKLFKTISSVCCTSFLWRQAHLAKHMARLIFRFNLCSNSYLYHPTVTFLETWPLFIMFSLCVQCSISKVEMNGKLTGKEFATTVLKPRRKQWESPHKYSLCALRRQYAE